MSTNTKNLTLSAVFMALVFLVTRFIQIPIPLGYFNVGNSVILLACLLVPSPYGIIVGSIGSALADLTSFPAYTIPTLIIKFLMPLVFYKLNKIELKKFDFRIISAAIATLIPLFGYTLTGGLLYGGDNLKVAIIAGFEQFPGLLLEYIANLVIFSALLAIPALRHYQYSLQGEKIEKKSNNTEKEKA